MISPFSTPQPFSQLPSLRMRTPIRPKMASVDDPELNVDDYLEPDNDEKLHMCAAMFVATKNPVYLHGMRQIASRIQRTLQEEAGDTSILAKIFHSKEALSLREAESVLENWEVCFQMILS